MTRAELVQTIFEKKNYLCVGLDTDRKKLPAHLAGQKDGMLRFNKAIIDATREHCVAYKINTAFYEAEGLDGWRVMEETAAYIGKEHLKIADAKRGDIGNTSSLYARAFFEQMDFDAITVAPYMGEDSLRPFLEYENKWTIVLGLTSNPGSRDFQRLELASGKAVFNEVMDKVAGWGTPANLMFVIGATQSSDFRAIREQVPEHFFLVPGIGAQGGSLEEVSRLTMNKDCGLLVNASRAIIYASGGEDFAEVAGVKAKEYNLEMARLLQKANR
jgi:orotidine-5'-phosphate decarboxylase